jgi:plasmid stabilization system protein ParE
MVIRWTTNAEERMDQIYRFYCKKSIRTAKKIADNIDKEVERLIVFPLLAPVESSLEGFAQIHRSLVVMKLFKIIYFVNNLTGEVIILDVWDCRQDPEELKKRVER